MKDTADRVTGGLGGVEQTREEPGVAIERQSMPDDFDAAFDRAFPAPEPRQFQKEVVREALKAYIVEDKDVVMIDAPPGFGKSITILTILKMLDGDSYYGTPLKSLQEQLVEDDFIGGELVEIMGRSNYSCILPDADPDTTVDVAKCQRDDDFECDIKGSCPYYAQKANAVASKITVQNLAYMMNVPMTMLQGDGQFSPRDVMVIDECQGTDDWAMNYIGIDINRHQIPDDVWEDISLPPESKRDDYDTVVSWLEDEVKPACENHLSYLDSMAMGSGDDVKDAENLRRFIDKVSRFLEDEQENEWTVTHDVRINKNRPNTDTISLKPIKVGRFIDSLLWDNCGKVLLSSATIPKGDWLSEVGLQDADVKRLSLPSTFPVENRPIVTSEAVGKMTYNEKHETMPDMVKKIKQIADHHDGEKGIIHCRGYNYVKMFKESCTNNGLRKWYKNNVHVQDRDAREESLEEWINNDKQVFLSVNMAEGIDLDGDKCRWQCLLKTKYPSMGDERVKYRVEEMNDWDWYNQQAVIQLEQAYGRAVRSDEDEAVFYILDESAVNLIERNERLFHDWFLEAIQ